MNEIILVVDDREELRKLIRISLEMKGYIVYEAEDGESALRKIEVIKPELIILDIMMPGRYDGFQVCEIVKSKYKKIKIFIVSARAQKLDKDLGQKLGADMYITKPFSPIKLQQDVMNALNSREE